MGIFVDPLGPGGPDTTPATVSIKVTSPVEYGEMTTQEIASLVATFRREMSSGGSPMPETWIKLVPGIGAETRFVVEHAKLALLRSIRAWSLKDQDKTIKLAWNKALGAAFGAPGAFNSEPPTIRIEHTVKFEDQRTTEQKLRDAKESTVEAANEAARAAGTAVGATAAAAGKVAGSAAGGLLSGLAQNPLALAGAVFLAWRFGPQLLRKVGL